MTEVKEELKPCPFCGWKEPYLNTSLYGTIGGKERHYHVMCGHCTCLGGHDISEDVAIELWNRRVNDGKID